MNREEAGLTKASRIECSKIDVMKNLWTLLVVRAEEV